MTLPETARLSADFSRSRVMETGAPKRLAGVDEEATETYPVPLDLKRALLLLLR
jgi:hypothetical protein